VRLIARREDERGLLAEVRCELLLELVVELHRSVDEARARHARTEPIDRRLRRLTHLGMRGEPEVIVRAEHHHATAVDHRLGAVVQIERTEEGVHAHLPRVVRGEELITLLEYVLAADARERRTLPERLVEARRLGARDSSAQRDGVAVPVAVRMSVLL